VAKNILVIDDEESVRDAYCLALEPEGYIVDLASNGLDGLEAAKSKRPDMVFLDFKMSGISGVETLKRLREIDSTIPVYIITAFIKEHLDELTKARSEGCVFDIAANPLNSYMIRQFATTTLSN
jgi:CheY-like chemotaxis protein